MQEALNWSLNAQTPFAWTMLFLKSCVRAVYHDLYQQMSVHFAQSPQCRHKFQSSYQGQAACGTLDDAAADKIDAISLLPMSPSTTCHTCCHIYDRVHEAAYSLIPERLRARAHLRIGAEVGLLLFEIGLGPVLR